MPYATGTLTSATAAKDMMGTLQTALTGSGYQLVDSYATPSATSWFGSMYGNNTYVTYIAGAPTVAVSTDNAVTWTQKTLPNPATINQYQAGAFGAGLFVLVAAGTQTYVTSPDGITWTARTLPVAPSLSRQNLVWTGTQFILYTTGTVVMTSPDGITWTQRTVASGSWTLAASGGGVHIAVNASGSNTYLYSNDGVAWTTKNLPATGSWGALTYGNGLFVVMINGSTVVYTSPDGVTWTGRTAATAGGWQALGWGGNQFVALPGNNAVTYVNTSPTGTTWTQQNNALPLGAFWNSILWANNQWLATGSGAAFAATSPDGITWTARTLTGTAFTPYADVYKSPAASNSLGQDWYLILRRSAEAASLIYYQVCEQYDPVQHRASIYGGTGAAATVPVATTYANPAAAGTPDNGAIFGAAAYVTLNVVSAFTYWLSATPDRVVFAVKTTTTDQAFYAGLYEDLLPAGTTQFPLMCAILPTDALMTQIGGGSAPGTGGYTREPLQAASNPSNFSAVISNGMHRGWTSNVSTYGFVSNGGSWTPGTTAAALYGNPGSFSRVLTASTRSTTFSADAFRGLLYGMFTCATAALTGDTVTYAGRTYVRVGGFTQTAAYGFYVDSGL